MLAKPNVERRWMALTVLGLLMLAGCETTDPAVTNTAGRYDTIIDAPTTRVTQAALTVLEDDYKFTIESHSATTIDGKIEARTAQGTKVLVWVERRGDSSSLMQVRVGEVGGDKQLSMEILDKTKERSKTLMEKLRGK